MSYNVCKIIPTSSFHLGEKGIGLEEVGTIIHSDTLFNAICNCYRLIYGKDELESFIENAKTNLKISSAFLEVGNIKTFPLPLNKISRDEEVLQRVNEEREKKLDNFDLIKELKRIKFVSESIFKEISKDPNSLKEYITNRINNEGNKDNEIIKQSILFKEDEIDRLIQENTLKFYDQTQNPRVILDRKTSSSGIYYFGETIFAKGCNLFFLMEYKENSEKIKSAIRLLGDEGIGGDRTSGKGLFNTQFREFFLSNNGNGNKFLSLNLIYPKREEVKYAEFYEFILRRGYVYSIEERTERRKSIRMFTEGSIFSNEVEGDIKDVSINNPKHRIYRFGKAFLVKMGGKNEY